MASTFTPRTVEPCIREIAPAKFRIIVRYKGAERSFTRDTVSAARRAKRDAQNDFEAGLDPYNRYRQDAPADDVVLLRDWARRWVEAVPVAPNTRANLRGRVEGHIIKAFGDRPMTDGAITRMEVRQWLATLQKARGPRGKPYSAQFVGQLVETLAALMWDAIDEPSINLSSNPAARIKTPGDVRRERPWLSAAEAAAIADLLPDCYAEMTIGLWATGLRCGEMIGADRPDVNLLRRPAVLTVPEPIATDGHTRYRSRGKSPRAVGREVELPPFLIGRWTRYLGHDRLMVMPGPQGGRMWYSRFRKDFARAAEKIGRADATPHALRRGHRTVLGDAGCHERAINDRMGHASRGMAGIYQQVTPAMRARILETLEAAWADLGGGALRLGETAHEG